MSLAPVPGPDVPPNNFDGRRDLLNDIYYIPKPIEHDELDLMFKKGYIMIKLDCKGSKEKIYFQCQLEQEIWKQILPSRGLHNEISNVFIPTLGTKRIRILASYLNKEAKIILALEAPFNSNITLSCPSP